MRIFFGINLVPTSTYGFRIYVRGAALKPHLDNYKRRILGSIINVDKNVDEDWPLEIYDNNGKLHRIYLEPGEIFMYESARLIHSRITPLNGDYYTNIYLHYLPELYELEVYNWEEKMFLEEGVNTELDYIKGQIFNDK